MGWGGSAFNGDDEGAVDTDGWWERCLHKDAMPLNCVLKNGRGGDFYVMCILPKFTYFKKEKFGFQKEAMCWELGV